jgi:hypothetical protein
MLRSSWVKYLYRLLISSYEDCVLFESSIAGLPFVFKSLCTWELYKLDNFAKYLLQAIQHVTVWERRIEEVHEFGSNKQFQPPCHWLMVFSVVWADCFCIVWFNWNLLLNAYASFERSLSKYWFKKFSSRCRLFLWTIILLVVITAYVRGCFYVLFSLVFVFHRHKDPVISLSIF